MEKLAGFHRELNWGQNGQREEQTLFEFVLRSKTDSLFSYANELTSLQSYVTAFYTLVYLTSILFLTQATANRWI